MGERLQDHISTGDVKIRATCRSVMTGKSILDGQRKDRLDYRTFKGGQLPRI